MLPHLLHFTTGGIGESETVSSLTTFDTKAEKWEHVVSYTLINHTKVKGNRNCFVSCVINVIYSHAQNSHTHIRTKPEKKRPSLNRFFFHTANLVGKLIVVCRYCTCCV